MPFVYMVRCADGALYTGWTTDVTRRVAQHNAGRGARYTRMHRPVMLVYREEMPARATAMWRGCISISGQVVIASGIRPVFRRMERSNPKQA